MGYALKLPGLTLNNPTAPKSLLEPFGVAGVTHRFEADSFTDPVGTVIASANGWINKVNNTATSANFGTGAPFVGPKLGVNGRTTTYPTVDFAKGGNADFGIDSWAAPENTLAFLIGYYGSGTGRVFELMGRRMQVYAGGYELSSVDTAQTPKLQVLSSAVARPAADKLTLVVCTLSADGSADSMTVRNAGVQSRVSGAVSKYTAGPSRLRIGKGSGVTDTGPYIAAMGIWQRILTTSEIDNTLVPAMKTRFGIL